LQASLTKQKGRKLAIRRGKKNSGDGGAPVPPSRIENPFLVIAHGNADLQGHAGGGGPAKELVAVTVAFRAELNRTLDHTKAALATQMQHHPALLGGMIFRLRETAIAKSHRPIDLIQRANIQPAGHAHIDEMLVGSTGASMIELHRVIDAGNTQKLRANLSAILRIEPWTRARRNPEGTQTLRDRGQALLRAFSYHDNGASIAAWEAVLQLLRRLEIPNRILTIGDSKIIQLRDLDRVDDAKLDLILEHPAVRTMTADQRVVPVATGPAFNIPAAANQTLGQPIAGLPTVAVFDTGVAAGNLALKNWVSSRDTYVNPPDTNYEHGTAVASLVAGGSSINANFSNTACMVHDVCGLESGAGGYISDLIVRLQDAVKKKPGVKVWNLSLGAPFPCDEQLFSDFSQALDQLSDQYGVLFVVASGNYLTAPRRTWPTQLLAGEDRVSSPGESVRALTVGSIAHLEAADTVVKVGEPAPYTRRGPGPVFTPKPDIVHFGGNAHHTGDDQNPWKAGAASTAVLQANGAIARGFGTSYAAPLASAMAAHAWASLQGHAALTPSPSLVKALLIHAAQLANPNYEPWQRRYYGAGLPQSAVDVLYDRDDSFTLVFEAQLLPGNMRWRKAPYPVPTALLHNGKFRGEVIITAAYAPPLDAAYGAEYVRSNLDVNWGFLDGDRFHGKIPPEGEDGTTGLEIQQVKHGGKWAPVKTQRNTFTGGITGDTWALQASLTQRAFEPPLALAMSAIIVVTLRALDGNTDVHAQGIRAMRATNWVQNQLPVRVPITV
jgi:serine protease AprX